MNCPECNDCELEKDFVRQTSFECETLVVTVSCHCPECGYETDLICEYDLTSEAEC